VTHRTATLTRVHAGGLVGEALNASGETGMAEQVACIVAEEIAPLLRGGNAADIEGCWRRADVVTRRNDRDIRAGVRALSAVDCALWDLAGKAAGLPLYRLWGGARPTMRTLANAGYDSLAEPTAFADEMLELQALGFGGCKFKVGTEPARDAARARAARAAVGPDFVLCADANRSWTSASAIDFCRRVEGLRLRWLEEPCLWRNAREDDAHVRQISGMAICAGQSEISGRGCALLIESGAIDVCNFDASWGGGATEWRRVAGLAALKGIAMAQHGEPHLGAHLVGAAAIGSYVETHHPDRDPLFHGMIADRPALAGGFYTPGEGAGWGITLEMEQLDRYRIGR
jgi:D-arabinonate dehydratase